MFSSRKIVLVRRIVGGWGEAETSCRETNQVEGHRSRKSLEAEVRSSRRLRKELILGILSKSL